MRASLSVNSVNRWHCLMDCHMADSLPCSIYTEEALHYYSRHGEHAMVAGRLGGWVGVCCRLSISSSSLKASL